MGRESLKNINRLIDIANKPEEVNISFLEDFKRSVLLTESKHDGIPSQTFKPSSLSCARGCYYQIMGVKPDSGSTTFNMIGICNSGSDIHVRVQTAVMQMKDNGIDCEWIDVAEYVKDNNLDYLIVREKKGTETKLYDTRYGTYISFMCDGIIKYKGKYYILEIKTESSNKWYSRDAVDPKHHNQAISYSNSLGIDEVMFVYVDRDLMGMKAYIFHVTDNMRTELEHFFKNTQGYVERQIVPPKPSNMNKRICTYCSYYSQCKKDG